MLSKKTKSGISGLFLFSILLLIATSSLLLISCSGQDQNFTTEPEQQDEPEDVTLDTPGNNQDRENGEKSEPDDICNNMEFMIDPELPRVGLYAGRGSWDENVQAAGDFLDHYGFKWSIFDEEDAVNLAFEDHFDLIWFPGGFAAEYKNYISDHSRIRNFVNAGGLFIGSCAGAYYASDILRWQGTDYDYPLKFFEGKAVGPLSGLIGWGETGIIELAEDHPANHDFGLEKEVYYYDGPYFEPYHESEITILARYQVNEEPAVIAGEKGSGKYLLLGPHPEMGGYSDQSAGAGPDGDNGASWPWLYQSILWLSHSQAN